MLVIPGFGKQRQEYQEFKVTLGCIVLGQPGIDKLLYHRKKKRKEGGIKEGVEGEEGKGRKMEGRKEGRKGRREGRKL